MFKLSSGVKSYSLGVAIIFLLSLLDAFFTLLWIHLGIGEEANPILNYFLSWGVEWFLGVKISLTCIGCGILHVTQAKKFSQKSIIGLLILYIFLTLYHLLGFGLTFFNN